MQIAPTRMVGAIIPDRRGTVKGETPSPQDAKYLVYFVLSSRHNPHSRSPSRLASFTSVCPRPKCPRNPTAYLILVAKAEDSLSLKLLFWLGQADGPLRVDSECSPGKPSALRASEHVYFYAVHGADEATIKGYLERAYRLGREF